ncbi:ABC transporter permease [Promicromonospora sp. NPDC057488]|uniref:ABC transporter permease n=1 Tax=Promicromonospora sp. NPDC057488 TaxID=3346147 RepID=UPI003670CC48
MTSVETLPPTTSEAARADAGTPRAGGRRRTHRLRLSPGTVAAGLFLLLVVLWALAPQWFTSADPLVGVGAEALRPPSADHWFGTDRIGRDQYARVVHGARLSLQATVIALAIALAVSSVIGVVAGFVGGWVDEVLMRVVDVLLAIPGLLISLMLITVLGFGMVNIAIAVAVGSVASFARVTRSEVLKVRTAAYVESAAVAGVRWWSVLWRHVLPHASGPVLALAALEFGGAILSISALSFLGYGAAPPTPEWGSLVSDGRGYVATAWWLTTLPGIVVVLTVVAANTVSHALSRRNA